MGKSNVFIEIGKSRKKNREKVFTEKYSEENFILHEDNYSINKYGYPSKFFHNCMKRCENLMEEVTIYDIKDNKRELPIKVVDQADSTKKIVKLWNKNAQHLKTQINPKNYCMKLKLMYFPFFSIIPFEITFREERGQDLMICYYVETHFKHCIDCRLIRLKNLTNHSLWNQLENSQKKVLKDFLTSEKNLRTVFPIIGRTRMIAKTYSQEYMSDKLNNILQKYEDLKFESGLHPIFTPNELPKKDVVIKSLEIIQENPQLIPILSYFSFSIIRKMQPNYIFPHNFLHITCDPGKTQHCVRFLENLMKEMDFVSQNPGCYEVAISQKATQNSYLSGQQSVAILVNPHDWLFNQLQNDINIIANRVANNGKDEFPWEIAPIFINSQRALDINCYDLNITDLNLSVDRLKPILFLMLLGFKRIIENDEDEMKIHNNNISKHIVFKTVDEIRSSYFFETFFWSTLKFGFECGTREDRKKWKFNYYGTFSSYLTNRKTYPSQCSHDQMVKAVINLVNDATLILPENKDISLEEWNNGNIIGFWRMFRGRKKSDLCLHPERFEKWFIKQNPEENLKDFLELVSSDMLCDKEGNRSLKKINNDFARCYCFKKEFFE